jgi:hypothetical protein
MQWVEYSSKLKIFQIQGQLAITKKTFCDFIVYTLNDFFVERIKFDKDLWENVMLPKLNWFYDECLLPELVDSRLKRNMAVRVPEHFYASPGATSHWSVTDKD